MRAQLLSIGIVSLLIVIPPVLADGEACHTVQQQIQCLIQDLGPDDCRGAFDSPGYFLHTDTATGVGVYPRIVGQTIWLGAIFASDGYEHNHLPRHSGFIFVGYIYNIAKCPDEADAGEAGDYWLGVVARLVDFQDGDDLGP